MSRFHIKMMPPDLPVTNAIVDVAVKVLPPHEDVFRESGSIDWAHHCLVHGAIPVLSNRHLSLNQGSLIERICCINLLIVGAIPS